MGAFRVLSVLVSYDVAPRQHVVLRGQHEAGNGHDNAVLPAGTSGELFDIFSAARFVFSAAHLARAHLQVGKSHWRCTGDMRLGAALGLLQVAYLVAQDPSLVAQCRRLLARAYQQCAISHVELRTREALYVPSWSTHEVLSPGVSCAFAQELWRSYPGSGDVGEGCVTWPSGDKRAMRG